MVPAKTPYRECVIVLDVMFRDFRFYLHSGPENSVPMSFFSLNLRFIFRTLDVGCIKNAIIVCSQSDSMSELIANCGRRKVSISKV